MKPAPPTPAFPAAAARRWRAEDLLATPNNDERRLELDEGVLIEMSPVGRPHGVIVIRLGAALERAAAAGLGEISTEVGFILHRDPDTLRGPDLAFLRAERAARAEPQGFITGAPDLAVEVLSPSDTAAAITRKVRQYFRAGAQTVWLVDPAAREIQVLAADGQDRALGITDELTAPDLLPGWSLPLRDLFR